ncbi:Zn-ribbon domain-containing OB-fold protein [Microbacterium sp. NPDC089695]|uniref:Zn-ribbon domain-containing OB-fold protein n=1 Tax=Microbacterium sp. NPDC089695 TaxID=3364198 RepID=UPI0038010426
MNDTGQLNGPLRLVRSDDGLRVVGRRCPEAHHTTAYADFVCPDCGRRLEEAVFGPAGVVWSYTTITTPAPGRTPPFTLAYVDLADGPRILCDVPAAAVPTVAVGQRISVVEVDGRPAIAEEVSR